MADSAAAADPAGGADSVEAADFGSGTDSVPLPDEEQVYCQCPYGHHYFYFEAGLPVCEPVGFRLAEADCHCNGVVYSAAGDYFPVWKRLQIDARNCPSALSPGLAGAQDWIVVWVRVLTGAQTDSVVWVRVLTGAQTDSAVLNQVLFDAQTDSAVLIRVLFDDQMDSVVLIRALFGAQAEFVVLIPALPGGQRASVVWVYNPDPAVFPDLCWGSASVRFCPVESEQS